MGTEKDIFGKALYYNMGKEDKPKYDLPKRDDTPSLDYRDFLSKAKTGKPSFDAYVESLSGEMQTYDGADPYKKDALKGITDKADAFLKRHAGISYEDFLRQSKPETFTENDYGNLQPRERRKYFERDTATRLAALEDIEKREYNIDEALEEFEKIYGKVPPKKQKTLKEKTNKSLLESLVSHEGEIFERYLRTKDSESLYRDLREFSQEILDKYENLPQNERGPIDVIYHHVYGMEKFLESQSEDSS